MSSDQERTEEAEVRALLDAEVPDFLSTPVLADRALLGAARRRRARVRVFGGAGAVTAVTAVAFGVLAAGSGLGWGRSGSGSAADAPTTPGTSAMESLTRGSSGPAPTSAPTSVPASAPTTAQNFTPPYNPGPKYAAMDRVTTKLHSGHIDSFMGVGLSGVDYGRGIGNPGAESDQSPIVVYRKPIGDQTLESDAITAAKPYAVVFKDSVLDASEQWVLGQRIQHDIEYWRGQDVYFGTALEQDGTITIFAEDPDKMVTLVEQHYGYDGRVFVGRRG